ncbi:glycosyl hydrolase family 18 protein [Sulfoacidibacillus ferrooxidans]|uniref:GH18 domain-containing protein n=1 Tax=Sulfoacidibacillus ferrooxidans TaxID=2005001 RepID=A0A9X1V9T1_9BACL|nr:glycosyl hydrolase family 18 protein [Sulfoacidibacillus ferrooxidans]MCI0183899.1 hypothetical protein [Sulfoacidibacillus ferrooxidans]
MRKVLFAHLIEQLSTRILFIATTILGLIVAISLYGSSQFFQLASASEAAISIMLTDNAITQIAPSPLPSPVNMAYAFSWLSLAGVNPNLHFTLPISKKIVFPTSLPTISWNSLIQKVLTSGAASSRLTIGWTIDSSEQTISNAIAASPGLRVIAPKSFDVDGLDGALSGSISRSAVAYAHQHGVQVWAVVDNGFNGPLSHQILAYRDQQNMLITHIVQEAVNAHINGINLDFEGLLPEDRWNFTDFVQKLATALHAHHMDLSVDLPPDIVPDDNTGAYNHSALAKAANYIILMGYDEYWGGEQIAGPTASYPWVKQSINDMLNTGVPSSKLILGLPFYTQDWTVGKNDSALASEALSLWQTRTLLASTHAKETWNAKLGLHVASFVQNGVKHEIWIEDKRSLLLFADLVSEQHLAGAAAWYLGLETKTTWEALVDTVRSTIA